MGPESGQEETRYRGQGPRPAQEEAWRALLPLPAPERGCGEGCGHHLPLRVPQGRGGDRGELPLQPLLCKKAGLRNIPGIENIFFNYPLLAVKSR